MKEVSDVPFAVGSDGTVFVNVTHLMGTAEPAALLRRALAARGALLIGNVVTSDEARHMLEELDEGAREAVARVLAARGGSTGDRS